MNRVSAVLDLQFNILVLCVFFIWLYGALAVYVLVAVWHSGNALVSIMFSSDR